MQSFLARTDRLRWLIAFGLGLITALSLQPYELWPLWPLGAAGLFLLVHHQAGRAGSRPQIIRRAAALGWWFGFGYFLLGLYWIGNAFAVRGEEFVILMPFAMAALPMGLALFYALASGIASGLAGRFDLSLMLSLALSFAFMEWLRGFVLTGFPWNLPAQSFAADDRMAQSLAFIGPDGLSLIVLLITAGLAQGVIARERKWLGPGIAVALILILQITGALRLPDQDAATYPDIDLIVVQPNTDQTKKWKPGNAEGITQTLLRLSATLGPDDRLVPTAEGRKRIIVWPETAAPYYLQTSGSVLAAIAALLGPDDILITGSLRFDYLSAEALAAARVENPKAKSYASYNGLLVIDGDGQVIRSYDKHHLVPFGEYVPLRPILGRLGLRRVTEGIGDFGRGVGPRTLAVTGLPSFSPLICYEVVFPHQVTDGATGPGRAEWLVNVTNDAWYGDSPGPYQHLAQSRMRAIEQGLPMVRVAGTGISAVIDPYGRTLDALPLNQQGKLRSSLPRPLGATPYTQFGDLIFWILMVSIMIAIAGIRSITKSNQH